MMLSKLVIVLEAFMTRLLNYTFMNFDAESAVDDLQRVFSVARVALDFPSAFREYAFNRFLQIADVRFITKLLANPTRFKLSHVIAWNSFVTAAQSVQIEFPRFFALVRALVMVSHVDTIEIGPDLDPTALLYVFQHWQLDELFDSAPDWEGLGSKLRIGKLKTAPKLSLAPSQPFDPKEAGWNVLEWNNVKYDRALAEAFPIFHQTIRRAGVTAAPKAPIVPMRMRSQSQAGKGGLTRSAVSGPVLPASNGIAFVFQPK
jgi:hypothetical protein